ncbi:MAG: AAA family ATPase, partial [Pirellulales bacterium]|nr:AAA family ATPase [Pirellulales bacterium]
RGDRPLASLMLIGPTGVGKTETAKALARLIYSDASRLVRIDMSELSSPAAAGRLIGDAVHPDGVLTSAVRAQPFSLVLLDEFEKAHPSVFDLLLQVLGEGRLTDGQGRLADFRNSIVLMTSNLGVESFRAVPLGLAETQQQERYQSHFERHVREFLRPEMFNRIDRILTYNPLDEATVRRIARLRLEEIRQRDGWKGAGDRLDVADEALGLLASDGYQLQYGARPLSRELERRLVTPLSEAICDSGRLSRLTAIVERVQTHPEAPPRIAVQAKSLQKKTPSSETSVEQLIEQMTHLRRRSQALERCESVRRLRNQYTIVSRKIKSLIRKSTDKSQRDKIRFGPLGAHRLQMRQRLQQVTRLGQQVCDAEASVLHRYYQNQPINNDRINDQLLQLREQMWNLLCLLRDQTAIDNQRITLAVSGANLAVSKLLLEAYQQIAAVRHWNFEVHALLRRSTAPAASSRQTDDPLIEAEGWSERAAFRIATERDRQEQQRQEPADEQRVQSRLAAYRLLQADAITRWPAGTLALMITFRGKAASLAMESEQGVHTFHRPQQSKSESASVLVSAHRGMPIEYVAPDWLLQRQFQLAGHPRRWYDIAGGLVQDMTEGSPRPVKIDRQGRWLDLLVEQEMSRRIWSELDGENSEDSWDESELTLSISSA